MKRFEVRHNRNFKPSESRRGVAAVEFAIVAPILFLFVLAIVEVGRLMVVQQLITNASREGARQAVVQESPVGDIQDFVSTYLQNGSVPGATVSVVPDDMSALRFGDPVTVSVSVPFDRVSWFPTPFLFQGRTLLARTTMRAEGP